MISGLIFRNNAGFANTNSNIESFNATIKRDFTGRRRMSIGISVLINFNNHYARLVINPNISQYIHFHSVIMDKL